MARADEDQGRQGIAVDVAVIGQHAGGGDDQRNIFVRRVSIVRSHRRVVHGPHSNAGRRDRRSAAVAGAVSERIRAVVVRGGGVDEAAVAVEQKQTVARAADDRSCERVAVIIAVVGQHAGGGDGQRSVFVSCVSIVQGNRRVTDRTNREIDGGRRRSVDAIGGLVGERVRAVVIGGRRVSEAAIWIERDGAVRRACDEHRRDRQPIEIVVVGQHAGGGHA